MRLFRSSRGRVSRLGAYLQQAVLDTLVSPGASPTRYRQDAVGLDAELSRDRWVVRAEVMHNTWGQPVLPAGVARRNLRATVSMLEARYTLLAGLYLAGRAGHPVRGRRWLEAATTPAAQGRVAAQSPGRRRGARQRPRFAPGGGMVLSVRVGAGPCRRVCESSGALDSRWLCLPRRLEYVQPGVDIADRHILPLL